MQKHEDGSVRIWQSYVWSRNGEAFFVSTCRPYDGVEGLQTIVCEYDHVMQKCGEPFAVAEGVDDHASFCMWIADSDTPVDTVLENMRMQKNVQSILREGWE